MSRLMPRSLAGQAVALQVAVVVAIVVCGSVLAIAVECLEFGADRRAHRLRQQRYRHGCEQPLGNCDDLASASSRRNLEAN